VPVLKGNEEDEPYAMTEDTSEWSSVEKVLQLIERMANSDGVHKKLKQGHNSSLSIKCNLLEKKDILEPFRHKYAWYFRTRYWSQPKKNFDDVLEMSSVWDSQKH
jgi:hypothetical protein